MKYKTIGVGLGGNERNDINKNFEDIDADIKSVILNNGSNSTAVAQALTDAANAKSTADAAKVTAEGISATASDAKTESLAAVATATEAKTTAETVRDQFDSVVAEAGSNNPEVVQARGSYTNLNQRLDSTAQQLADTETQLTEVKATKAEKGELLSGLNAKRDKTTLIKKTDLDISSDSSKLGLENLSDEARQAIAGNAPVFTGLAENSVVVEHISKGAVTPEKMKVEKWLYFSRPNEVTVDFVNRLITIPTSVFFLASNSLVSATETVTLTLPTTTSGNPQVVMYKNSTRTFSIKKLGINTGKFNQEPDEYLVAILNRESVMCPQSNSMKVIEGAESNHRGVSLSSIKSDDLTIQQGGLLLAGDSDWFFQVDFKTKIITIGAGTLFIQTGLSSQKAMTKVSVGEFHDFSAFNSTVIVGFYADKPTELKLLDRATAKEKAGHPFVTLLNMYDGRVYCPNMSIVKIIGGKANYLPNGVIDEAKLTPTLQAKINGSNGGSVDKKLTLPEFMQEELEHPSKRVKIKMLGSSSLAGQGGSGYSATGESIGTTGFKVNEKGYCHANLFKKFVETRYGGEREVSVDNRFFKIENEVTQDIPVTSRYIPNAQSRLGVDRRIYGANTKITIPFYGTQFKIYYSSGQSIYDFTVSVDGGIPTEVIAPTRSYLKGQLHEVSNLPNGYHEAVIRPLHNLGISETDGRLMIESVAFTKEVVVKNWGVSGKNTNWMMNNRETLIEEDDTIIWDRMGSNDRNTFSVEAAKQYHSAFVEYVLSLGKHLILNSTHASAPADDYQEVRKFKTIDIDRYFREMATEYDLYFISDYVGLIDFIKMNRTTTLTELLPDGLHPNNFGYEILYENWMEQLGMGILSPEDNTLDV